MPVGEESYAFRPLNPKKSRHNGGKKKITKASKKKHAKMAKSSKRKNRK